MKATTPASVATVTNGNAISLIWFSFELDTFLAFQPLHYTPEPSEPIAALVQGNGVAPVLAAPH
jgi:hypothetical protein